MLWGMNTNCPAPAAAVVATMPNYMGVFWGFVLLQLADMATTLIAIGLGGAAVNA